MRILDRYVIREVLWPFLIGLLVFTFMLIIPFLIEYAESFISKGVPVLVVGRVMVTLVPSVLALTIPMSLLLGLLVGFGRLSADREFVAMQACGVSLMRLGRCVCDQVDVEGSGPVPPDPAGPERPPLPLPEVSFHAL
jgi:lipopolysaccharide export system permease protein